MSNTRQAGYYWVKLNDKWCACYWCTDRDMTFKNGFWNDGHFLFSDSPNLEINETRIPAPDEILQTEDSLRGLLETVQRLTLYGIDFSYNAKTQTLTYQAPGIARSISATVGFNFGETDK